MSTEPTGYHLADGVQIAAWVERPMRDALRAAARRADLSISQWLRRAIAEKLDREVRDDAE